MFDKRLRAFAFFGLIGFAATGLAQDKLSGGDKKWMENEVGPIITKQEISTFQEINKDDRKLFKELFWIRRDFSRGTKDNEFEDNYEVRREAADEQFKSRRTKGSETDMGKIFLLLGSPSRQERGRTAGAGGLPGADIAGGSSGASNPDDPGSGGGGSEGFDEDLRGSNTPNITWIYDPSPSLGIPEGLAIEFRNQAQFGYRISNLEDIDARLERAKERFISNPGVNYARDEKGRLRKADNKFDPNSPAKKLLASLRETGEVSAAIDFIVTPVFFRSSAGQVYIPIDIGIAEGLTKDEVTIFGSVENADGFEIYQFEEPAKIAENKNGLFSYEMPLQLAPGLYTLYVGLLDPSQVHGTQIIDLEVPDFDSGGLKLSSMLLFSGAEQTGESMGQPGKAFLLGGYHFTPKRELVYTHTDQFSGVFNAYNYGLEGDKPNLTVQVRFFKDGQARGQTKEEGFMLQSAEMSLTIFDIPLSIPNFKDPGTYKIEIDVTDKVTGEKLKEELEFVIEG